MENPQGSSPAVSVIMPVYNAPEYLRQSIRSVLNSSFTDFELLLIDDGSTDNSAQVCHEFVRLDKRVIYFYKENGGVASARSMGLEKARGTYVLFIDDDDYMSPELIRIMHQSATEHDADLCSCNWYAITGSGQTVTMVTDADTVVDGNAASRELARYLLTSGFIAPGCQHIKPGFLGGVIWNTMYRLQFLREHGLTSFFFFWNHEDDWIFNISCYMNANRVCFVKEPLYHYQVLDSSYSHKKRYIDEIYEKRRQGVQWIHSQIDAISQGCEKRAYMYKGILQRKVLLYTLYNETAVDKPRSIHDALRYIRAAVSSEKKESINPYIYLQSDALERLYMLLLLHHGIAAAYLMNRFLIKKYR